MKYRIQICDGGKWRTLKLQDCSITCDSEARNWIAWAAGETGKAYRAQTLTAVGWMTMPA